MNRVYTDEIDIIGLLKKLYVSRKTIVYVTILFSLVGVVFALLSPIKYSSSTIFIPQNQETNTSSFSGVASLVGISLGSANLGNEIPASMYPQIAESPKFKRLLLNKIIDKRINLTLKQFLIENYKIVEENDMILSPYFVSKLEENCFKILNDLITVQVNQKDGFITITASMPNAIYAAVLANFSKEILQEIIIENKIVSARQNLIFSQNQLKEKRIEFDEIQNKLSNFKDSNLNLVNSRIINQQDKLEAEFQIINAVVTELSKQVEQSKLQVKKDTPVFSTIKEAVIPNNRTSPKRTQTVILFSFIGFITSLIIILFSDSGKKIYLEILKK